MLELTRSLLRRLSRLERPLIVLVLFLGIYLRINYVVHTSIDQFAYDHKGHLQYIRFVINHWQIPPADAGWLFYHPPLFYFLFAALFQTIKSTGLPITHPIAVFQTFSCILSILTLFLSIKIVQILLAGRHLTLERLLGFLIVAVAPPLIMMSSRVNNDSLCFLIMSIALLYWQNWRHPTSDCSCLKSSLYLGLACLTKGVAGTAVPVHFLLWLAAWRKGKIRIRSLILGSLIIAGLVGPYMLWRHTSGDSLEPIANSGGLDDGLRVTLELDDLLTFNPIAMVEIPFVNSRGDNTRRDNLWEFIFRSFFSGEFEFRSEVKLLAQSIIATAIILLAFIFWGLIVSSKRFTGKPLCMYLLMAFPIFGSIAVRIIYPYSCVQDYRYIVITLFPLIYFLMIGVRFSYKPLRLTGAIAILIACSLQICLFLVGP